MRNIYRNILGWMAAAVALLATSCMQDDILSPEVSGDEFEVTFSIATQGAMGGTRAGETLPHISDGKKANMLIYAIYDENYNLLTQYGEGPDQALQDKGIELGEGQTAFSVDQFPVENKVSVRLVRGRTYYVAFWAQSADCKAYNTKDLKKVEVIYGAEKDSDGSDIKTPNNDESRDVFCQVTKVASELDRHQTVTLYRPLAQINVGTSGYDFETATRGENSKKYRYSKIQISSAARYLSVVENKVLTSTTSDNASDNSGLTTEVRATLTYDFAPIAAYYNVPVLPDDPSTVVENEEYLRIDLDGSKTISGYVDLETYKKNEEQATEDREHGKPVDETLNYTETFKYLSMCYILVPVQESNADVTGVPEGGAAGGTNEYTTTLDNVIVWLAENDDPSEEQQLEIVRLTNVPVHRNWRTNIVSPHLLTTGVELTVGLEPMYSGDYNTDDFREWSGPLAEGVFYDAIQDEIQISNLYGLQWLSRMVNGKYSYDAWMETENGSFVDGKFEDPGIQDPTTTEGKPNDPYRGMSTEERQLLKARIMRATHQEWNFNTGGDPETGGAAWPENNNFHFMHSSQNANVGSRLPSLVFPAKVRLTADIDLSGQEWIPIGFANNTPETFDVFVETEQRFVGFCGEFDGGNHTIRNLRNKRFGANVHDNAQQVMNFISPVDNQATDGKCGPYDKAVQWFGVGLFGQIGQNGSVSNLRLSNVDLLGYCHVGGVAGILTGQDAYIYNCYVDGGSIIAAPMYRGDSQRTNPTDKGRTFARGIFAGGIAGYLNIGRSGTASKAWLPDDPKSGLYASVQRCDVRNIVLRAYRQIGGIAGAINTYDKVERSGALLNPKSTSRRVQKIQDNNVSNVTIIADKFQPYDIFFNTTWSYQKQMDLGIYRNGFGWQQNQLAWSDTFVGGDPERVTDGVPHFYDGVGYDLAGKNSSSNVIITEFATSIADEATDTQRKAVINDVPLNLMPMLSSFFSDDVSLYANFTGNHSAYKKYRPHSFYSDSRDQTGTEIKVVPFNLPNDLDVDWDKTSGNVGMYIESITLHGDANNRDRTIVTVEDVTGEKDCIAYIASRDRSEFRSKDKDWNQQKTVIESLVFRGQPYAYTGICLAPSASTSDIELTNVSVYDVFQTLSLDNGADASSTTLTVSNSNLRGYTNYGANWKKAVFSNTVFERGAHAVDNMGAQVQTCEIRTSTTFDNCYFKAPYTINIAPDVTVTFDNCKATSTSSNVEVLTADQFGAKGGTIEITTDPQGNPVVTYNPAE